MQQPKHFEKTNWKLCFVPLQTSLIHKPAYFYFLHINLKRAGIPHEVFSKALTLQRLVLWLHCINRVSAAHINLSYGQLETSSIRAAATHSWPGFWNYLYVNEVSFLLSFLCGREISPLCPLMLFVSRNVSPGGFLCPLDSFQDASSMNYLLETSIALLSYNSSSSTKDQTESLRGSESGHRGRLVYRYPEKRRVAFIEKNYVHLTWRERKCCLQGPPHHPHFLYMDNAQETFIYIFKWVMFYYFFIFQIPTVITFTV